MALKTDAKYAIACVTSMGVRITPADRMAVHNSNHFYLQATSAETNVLNVASSLGHPCLALTKFVEGSPVAAFIKAQLRARNIAYEGKEVPQASRTPASAFGRRESGTTGPGRWGVPSLSATSMWSASSGRRELRFCTSAASSPP